MTGRTLPRALMVLATLTALTALVPGCDGTTGPPEGDRDGDGVPDGDDCDPDDPNVYPGAPDPYGDGLDADCDGDDGIDRDGDGYPGNAVSGDPDADCDDGDPAIHPGADEVCNGLDDDCDGALPPDETDGDGDGVMVCGGDCDDEDPHVYPDATERCNGLDDDCDGVPGDDEVDGDGDGVMVCENDCDDDDPDVHPGADEACNGLDDDCDGVPGDDEIDGDGDGLSACEGDCDDGDPDIYPGAPERCNGLDDDCDGTPGADEVDDDGDGSVACADCDDGDPDIYPGAPERCNGLDDDCDGAPAADETDGDGDGVWGCDGDCDDSDPDVYPGVHEVPDGVDNDCDGLVDEDPCQLVFDGSDDVALVGAADTPALDGPLTVEAWVRVDAAAAVWHSLIAGRWGTSADGTLGVRLFHDTSSGAAGFSVSPDGVAEMRLVGTTDLVDGAWHHLAGVYDGAHLSLYVDGVLEDQLLYGAGVFDNGLGLTLGDYNSAWIQGNYAFQLEGSLAVVRLSDDAIYSGPSVTPPVVLDVEPTTTLLLQLDEGAGQDLYDQLTGAALGTLGLTGAAEADDPSWTCALESF